MIPAPRDVDDLTETVRRVGTEVIMPRFRDVACDDVETTSNPSDVWSCSLKPRDHAARLLLSEEAGRWAAVDSGRLSSPMLADGLTVAAGSEVLGQDIVGLAAALP